MKVKLLVCFEDGSSEIVEIEKSAGAHPDSIATIVDGILEAEKFGKQVSKIGRSKINPFSSPPRKLVIDDSQIITREKALEILSVKARPIPDKYAPLYK